MISAKYLNNGLTTRLNLEQLVIKITDKIRWNHLFTIGSHITRINKVEMV